MLTSNSRVMSVAGALLTGTAAMAAGKDVMDRTALPIHPPKVPTYTELDVRNVKRPEHFDVTAPQGAPNVLVILIDDMGFGIPSAFGGPARMPTQCVATDRRELSEASSTSWRQIPRSELPESAKVGARASSLVSQGTDRRWPKPK